MKMSLFVGCDGSYYKYNRDGKEYTISSGLLTSLFKTYGYCLDPGSLNGVCLNIRNIEHLKSLAAENNDSILVKTLNEISDKRAPSYEISDDSMMGETLFNEKNRFDRLAIDIKHRTLSNLKTILNIGLYLCGWRGSDEPYITSPRLVHDAIRVELKVFPLIQSLYVDTNYPFVKNFPIIGYYRGDSDRLKPSIIDRSLNIDICLSRIASGINDDHSQLGSYLISTAYYYLTMISNTPVPMLEPLIIAMASNDRLES